jgi:hypothetical protein
MSKLRKSARGQQCTVRIPYVCNRDPETTVLAHLGGAGMGLKSSDLHGAFCCSACHDVIDRRVKSSISSEKLKNMHMAGIFRTQKYWLEHGFISIL